MCLHRGNIVLFSFAAHMVDFFSSLISFWALYEDWMYTPKFSLCTFVLRNVVSLVELCGVLVVMFLRQGLQRNSAWILRLYQFLMPLCIIVSRVLVVTIIYCLLDWRKLHEKKLADPIKRFPFHFYISSPMVMIYCICEWDGVNKIRKEIVKVRKCLLKYGYIYHEGEPKFQETYLTHTASDVHYEVDDWLGKGQYGNVFTGILTSGESVRKIAVKEIKTSFNEERSKILESEIKIMKHAGKHKHLVEFVGIFFEENDGFKILLEYCFNGSLENFVRTHKLFFMSLRTSSYPGINSRCYENVGTPECSWEDLYRFSFEIVLGMEYLSSKSIIHGDLAARNILLDENLTIKICDFGLSQHLYNYLSYVKCLELEQKPQPWRWMSIEALEDLKFSEKSDVWAFGVTCWEIFTLGDIPFQNQVWNNSLVDDLKSQKLKLEKPSHLSFQMWEILENCFTISEAGRPTFSQLIHLLEIEINRGNNITSIAIS